MNSDELHRHIIKSSWLSSVFAARSYISDKWCIIWNRSSPPAVWRYSRANSKAKGIKCLACAAFARSLGYRLDLIFFTPNFFAESRVFDLFCLWDAIKGTSSSVVRCPTNHCPSPSVVCCRFLLSFCPRTLMLRVSFVQPLGVVRLIARAEFLAAPEHGCSYPRCRYCCDYRFVHI